MQWLLDLIIMLGFCWYACICVEYMYSYDICHCFSLSGTCSHVVALVQTIIHYQSLGLKEVPADLPSTSLPQQWHKPQGKKINPEPASNIVLAKPGASKRKRRSVLKGFIPQEYDCTMLKLLCNAHSHAPHVFKSIVVAIICRCNPPRSDELKRSKISFANAANSYLTEENKDEVETKKRQGAMGVPTHLLWKKLFKYRPNIIQAIPV